MEATSVLSGSTDYVHFLFRTQHTAVKVFLSLVSYPTTTWNLLQGLLSPMQCDKFSQSKGNNSASSATFYPQGKHPLYRLYMLLLI